MNRIVSNWLLSLLVILFAGSLHAAPKELPSDLVWQTNDSDPIFADLFRKLEQFQKPSEKGLAI